MTTPDLTTYRAVHTALRLAPRRLEAAIGATDPTDARRIKAIAAYWRGYAGEVLAHHHVEDDHLFPVLVERVPDAAALIERTDADHERLDELMTACTAGVERLVASPGSDRVQLAAALDALAEHMDAHLDFEDAEILPRFEHHFTAEEYDVLDQAAAKSVGLGAQAAFTVPFVLATLPHSARAELIATAPLPFRILYALTKGRHDRLSARVFGPGAAAGAPGPEREVAA